jgi:hypothetical protein
LHELIDCVAGHQVIGAAALVATSDFELTCVMGIVDVMIGVPALEPLSGLHASKA